MTGVTPALISVPGPQSFETTTAAISDEALAIINVVTERPDWACWRSALTPVQR